MKANLNSMRYKATLNKLGHRELANGVDVSTNEPIMTFRFGYYRMSLVNDVQANVLDQLANMVTIFCRHSAEFVSDTLHTVTVDDVIYNIKEIEPDYDVNGLDVLVLKKVGLK